MKKIDELIRETLKDAGANCRLSDRASKKLIEEIGKSKKKKKKKKKKT